MKGIFASVCACAAVLMGFQAQGAEGAVYFVGGFNGWNISQPEIAMADADGVFVTEIDFSSNREFKMSTVDPEGSWNRFDEGTLYTYSSTKENEWQPIQSLLKSPNVVAPGNRMYTVKVDLDNMQMMFSTTPSGHDPWSGTLPVMYITTEDRKPITSKEDYLQATYYLDPMGVEGVEAVGSADEQALMQIRGRGNYTWWGFDKKPYRIKLDKKTPLMGMNKSKHFALLAHADDSAAGLRNALGFTASEVLDMPWTPATRPLEVVLNGDYIGLYWLTETVRVDADRVDVVEQQDLATEDVDGGWLVEIDNYDTDPHVTVMNTAGQPIWFTYKSPEELSTEQHAYLQTAMQAIQNALAAGNETSAAELVDFDILARYFIANQIMLDMESFHGSCYLNRQRGEAEKWKFGPVWDFGNAFAPGRADNPRFIFDHPDFSQQWIGEFYAMPAFVEAVKRVWKDFLTQRPATSGDASEALGAGTGPENLGMATGPELLEAALDSYAGEIAAAAIADGRRWPQYSHANVAAEAAKLQTWLAGSINWLKTQWGSETGIDQMEDFDASHQLRLRIEGRTLIIEVPFDTCTASFAGTTAGFTSTGVRQLPLTSVDGTTRLLTLRPGRNAFPLPSGLYILQGRKLLIP